MCGELAGNALATSLLVGLGLDELSMSAPAIPQVKEQIRQIDTARAQGNAREILNVTGVEAVLEKLQTNQVPETG